MENKPRIADELERMEYEPLLPAEMWLIAISLLLGVVLLVVFVAISRG
jgi:hypothetical protein